MKITKLHLLLIVVAVIMVYVFVDNTRREQARLNEIIATQEKQLREQQTLLDELRQREAQALEKKKAFVTDAVAIAGEYWLITRQEHRDVAGGQDLLHRAKEALKNEDLDNALDLAKQSMEALRTAPRLRGRSRSADVYYKVRWGDTLWGIAAMQRHFGRGAMWPRIWRLNKQKIADPNLIYPKQIFLIKKAK
jgi:nucleoid-associated protein YgaU